VSALYRTMLRLHGRSMLWFGLGSMLYLWLVIYIFPSISSEGMDAMIKNLPENVVKIFGLEGFNKLTNYVVGEYYTFMFLILMMVYCLLTPTRLLVKHTDRGTMSFLLSTSVSRTGVILTQLAVLITGILFIGLCNTLGGIAGDMWLLEDPELDRAAFVKVNGVGFLLFTVVSAYSFLFSAWFSDERKALSLSAGLTILFFALDLAGKMGEKLEWMRSLSIFSLFEPMEIVKGEEILGISIGLGLAALVLFSLSVLIFRRRDFSI